MWKKQQLKLSPQAEIALENNAKGIISPFSLSAKGTKIGVHNWSHGIQEKSNRYLSPENAVKVLAQKLVDYSDPNRPKDERDIVIIMVTSPDIDQFISALEKVRLLLPESTFRQALDYAKSSKTLQETKMIKTPTISSPAFSNDADITPGSNRTMQSILRNAQSAAVAIQAQDPSIAIEQLLKLKAEKERKNKEKVKQMLTAMAQVYAFVEHSKLEQAESKIFLNVPSAGHIFTACVMFIGADLSAIKGMLNDDTNKTTN